ncbi:hypothetical protein A0H81_05809 [Grifola frondosa]|uniref:Uncharacterized protein n=1 Tax=Grifola frondosa TaxID=5627 RepID=A0A1C7ME73_GRIFR|nr:hypothetical protein A0H81_05809 [Grifola frondosa]
MSSEQDSTLLGSLLFADIVLPSHNIFYNATISPTPSSPKALLPLPPLDPMPASAPSIDVVVDSPEPAPVPSTPALPLPEPEIAVLPSPHDDSLATSDLPHVECVSLSESIVCGPDSDMPLSPPPPQPLLFQAQRFLLKVVSPPPPPPPPPTKVKLSLKDFALRKKKQRRRLRSRCCPLLLQRHPALNQKAPSVATVSGSESSDVDMDIGRLERDSAEKDHSDEGPKVSEESPSVSQWEKAHVDVFMSPGDSLRAKVELVEEQIPNGLVAADCGVLDACLLQQKLRTALSPSSPRPPHVLLCRTTRCMLALVPNAIVCDLPPRPLSEEDGEIFSPPPPKPPPFAPRSHSPPTQPRSFHSGDVSPLGRSSPAPVRRPLHPAPYRAHLRTQDLGHYRVRRGAAGPQLSDTFIYVSAVAQPEWSISCTSGPSADRDRDRRTGAREAWIPGPSRGEDVDWELGR